jgi:methionyl-tRNA formyltransferase
MLIQILIDNPGSWILPSVEILAKEIKTIFSYDTIIVHNHKDVIEGEILIMLSCEKKFKRLDLNKKNLVVHESNLPKGKGWSPVTWQVLEGKKEIQMTLFEANDSIDSGEIYLKKSMQLNGDELLKDIKELQGKITNELIIDFLKLYPNIKGVQQSGDETFYKKRTSSDSELDINKTILEQFNLLRVCDNDRYPAFFIINGKKYVLKIFEQ